uniref:Uncharacterized protein n=1 Tax=Romanomermis culicivorax TaxID=13658 RepID=A0A915IHQ3_ROMCU
MVNSFAPARIIIHHPPGYPNIQELAKFSTQKFTLRVQATGSINRLPKIKALPFELFSFRSTSNLMRISSSSSSVVSRENQQKKQRTVESVSKIISQLDRTFSSSSFTYDLAILSIVDFKSAVNLSFAAGKQSLIDGPVTLTTCGLRANGSTIGSISLSPLAAYSFDSDGPLRTPSLKHELDVVFNDTKGLGQITFTIEERASVAGLITALSSDV